MTTPFNTLTEATKFFLTLEKEKARFDCFDGPIKVYQWNNHWWVEYFYKNA